MLYALQRQRLTLNNLVYYHNLSRVTRPLVVIWVSKVIFLQFDMVVGRGPLLLTSRKSLKHARDEKTSL